MTTAKTQEHEIGWDDEINAEAGSEFGLLPPGDYGFQVQKFERGRFAGSPKMPACNQATLTLLVGNEEIHANVQTKILLHSRTEWVLASFAKAIGQRKSGDKIAINWGQVAGSTGRCTIGVRKYVGKDNTEKEANEVKKWLPPDDEATSDTKEEASW